MATAAELIPLDSPKGQQWLRESEFNGDFYRLVRFFQPQQNLAYCGVASSAIVLNALPGAKPEGGAHGAYGFFTQENLFTPAVEAVRPRAVVQKRGMTLDQLAGILAVHEGVEVVAVHAGKSKIETLRKTARRVLKNKGEYLLVNYLRKAIGQERGGHISPVAAYHAGEDAFLILDVAPFKYPPVWVRGEELWRSLETIDDESGESRGYVVVARSLVEESDDAETEPISRHPPEGAEE